MIKDYFKLIKFKYHLSFILVILGAFFFGEGFGINYFSFKNILLTYISFNLLMYTGLYTLNDIFDKEDDSKHPGKKNRPIASGRIKVKKALIIAIILIVIGLLISIFIKKYLILLYLLFIIINLFYSKIGKKIKYIEIITNSITHPLRFFMGAFIFNLIIPYPTLITIFIIAIGLSTDRRIIEKKDKGEKSRRVLKKYSQKELGIILNMGFIILLLIFWINYPNYKNFYITTTIFYIMVVLLFLEYKELETIFKKIWLK